MAYKYCPECGTKLDSDMKFCPNCGYALALGVSAPQTSPQTKKTGTLGVVYDGTWVIIDAKYEFHLNGEHYKDFSFKRPFKFDIPLVQEHIKLKVKKLFLSWSFDFHVDPSRDYLAKLKYDRISRQFNMSVYDDNGKRIYKDTLF